MGDFKAGGGEFTPDGGQQLQQQVVAVELTPLLCLLRCQPDVGIEPAKQGFAIGVAVIVEVGDGGCCRAIAEHGVAPGVNTGALAGRQLKQPSGWEFASECLPQLRPQNLIGNVNLIDDDALGLFELLAIDVLNVFGEPRPGG